MINYSKDAMESYVSRIEIAQHKLSQIPIVQNGFEFEEMYWLIHVALDDLKRLALKEWNEELDAEQKKFADMAKEQVS